MRSLPWCAQRGAEDRCHTSCKERVLSRLPSSARPWLTVLGIGAGLAIPLLTLPRLPEVSPWPALLGLLPWVIGKYVLCPLRWHAISESQRGKRWHLSSYAESELLGLLTPGHVGADLWRIRRLRGIGMPRSSAVAEVALDRLLGAIALVVFVAFAASTLPLRMLLTAGGLALAAAVVLVLLGKWRPGWVPRRSLPPPRRLMTGVLFSLGYQASIVALLTGTLFATGYALDPLHVLGAFGVSQLAGSIPGPHGASPRDGALVVALVALGVPVVAAMGAVALKANLAWGPALLLGGGCLLVRRRRSRGEPEPGTGEIPVAAAPAPVGAA